MPKYIYLLSLLPFIWISCADDNMTFDIGNDEIDVRTHMGMIDTFTVRSYSLMLDSIPTSGLKNPAVVVGKYTDEEIGIVSASSFFRIDLPSKVTSPSGTKSYEIHDDAVFDSLRLFLVYNGYFGGDTTLPFAINLHRLNGTLRPNTDGYFYNNDSIAAMPDIIGRAVFRPSPNSGDTVWITIDGGLGAEMFEKMKENQTVMVETEYFQEYFRGFMLRYDENNNALIGFKFPGESSTVYPAMRMYYHYYEYATVKKYFDFLAQTSLLINNRNFQLQFNRFTLRNPKIVFPSARGNALPVSLTGNHSYAHAGLGIVTRLEIPYLKNIQYLSDNIRILDARLEVEPVSGTYDEFSLPANVSLVRTDNINRWIELVYDKSNKIYVGGLQIDMLYQEDTRYTFDVTNFLKSKLDLQSDMIPAMLLSVAPEDMYKTEKRLIVGSQNHKENKIKLKVYYMNVD